MKGQGVAALGRLHWHDGGGWRSTPARLDPDGMVYKVGGGLAEEVAPITLMGLGVPEAFPAEAGQRCFEPAGSDRALAGDIWIAAADRRRGRR